MTDTISKKERSGIMSKVRGKNSKIELCFKKYLRGLHFQYQPLRIYGKPDFAIKRLKIALFIDSCFWHRCLRHFRAPHSNRSYWIPKINRNVARDKKVNKELRKEGWAVFRFWEHQIRRDPEKTANIVIRAVRQRR